MPEFHTAAAEYRYRSHKGMPIPFSLARRLAEEGADPASLAYRKPATLTDQEIERIHG